MTNGHDADAVRAKARETIARVEPTPESIAEQEERRQRNRIAEIMTRSAPSQEPLVYRRTDDAVVDAAPRNDDDDAAIVIESDRRAQLAEIRAAAERLRTGAALRKAARKAWLAALRDKSSLGLRLTRAERVGLWAYALDAEIGPLLRAGQVGAAIQTAMLEMAAHSIALREIVDKLEDRIAALEADAGRA